MASKKKATAPVFVLWDEPERFVPETAGNKGLPESERVAYDLLPYTNAEARKVWAKAAQVQRDREAAGEPPMDDEEAAAWAERELFAIQVRGVHNLKMRRPGADIMAVLDPRMVYDARHPELTLHVSLIQKRLREMGEVDPNS